MSSPSRTAADAAGFGGKPVSPPMLATDWRAVVSNTLRGFFTLRLSTGIVLREVSYHEQGDKGWVGLPGKPQLDDTGKHRTDPATGKKAYIPVVEIPDKDRRENFQRQALAAVDRMLEGGR
jgi:hypothetical protein